MTRPYNPPALDPIYYDKNFIMALKQKMNKWDDISKPPENGEVSKWVPIPVRPHHKIGCYVERLDGYRVPICISAIVTAMEKEFPPEPEAMYPSYPNKKQIIDFGDYTIGIYNSPFSW